MIRLAHLLSIGFLAVSITIEAQGGSWWVSPQMGLLQLQESLEPSGSNLSQSFQDSSLALNARVMYFPTQSRLSFGSELQVKLISFYTTRPASSEAVWAHGFMGYDLPSFADWLETTVRVGPSYRGSFLSIRSTSYQDSFGVSFGLFFGVRTFKPMLLSFEPGVRLSSRGIELSAQLHFDSMAPSAFPLHASIGWVGQPQFATVTSNSAPSWNQWTLLFGAQIF